MGRSGWLPELSPASLSDADGSERSSAAPGPGGVSLPVGRGIELDTTSVHLEPASNFVD